MNSRKLSSKGKNAKHKVRKLRFWPLFLLCVLFLGGIAYLLSLPIWQINDVVVNGAKLLSPEEIKALAGIPLSENLFYARFTRAKTNLDKIAAIKKYKIYRIPPGTVLINIVERKPVASIIFPGKSYVIDEEGCFLNLNAKLNLDIANMVDLPVVSGLNEKEILRTNRLDPHTNDVVWGIISKFSRFLEAKKMQLDLGGLQDISLLLDDVLWVRLGNAQNFDRKMQNFKSLLPKVAGKWTTVEYIDVRFPDNPVIKFK